MKAKHSYHSLAEALTTLQNEGEGKRFLRDLLTLDEIEEFEMRWAIAQLLWSTELTYRQIAEKLNTSTTTVSRVARFLQKEPHQGYKIALSRLEPKE